MTNYGNSRSSGYIYYNGRHKSLSDLIYFNPNHRYLRKQIVPSYPDCVFRTSKVSHVTEMNGLCGIMNEQGFKGNRGFLYWGLSVTDEDIANAEHNLQWFPQNRTSFLNDFTTSPAFQRESRYGNFRFTFTLKELLHAYSKQFCDDTSPVLRILDTKLYRQEVVYSVLVHPRRLRRYRKYPRLPVNEIGLCSYSRGTVSWNCQSPSDKYQYYLDEHFNTVEQLPRPEYYVWDNIVVAFHMKKHWVLSVNRRRLVDNLSACETSAVNLLREPAIPVYVAERKVDELKHHYYNRSGLF